MRRTVSAHSIGISSPARRTGSARCTFSISHISWWALKSKQEFDRLREKYKIHISESELRMWKTDNTLGNVR